MGKTLNPDDKGDIFSSSVRASDDLPNAELEAGDDLQDELEIEGDEPTGDEQIELEIEEPDIEPDPKPGGKGSVPNAAIMAAREKNRELREENQRLRAEQAKRQAAEEAAKNFKPDVFQHQAELDALNQKAENDEYGLSADENRRLVELNRALGKHEAMQESRREQYASETADFIAAKAIANQSIASFKTKFPKLSRAFDEKFADNLTDKDFERIFDAGDKAGKTMFDLLVARNPELRVKGSSPNLGTNTNNNQGAVNDDDINDEPPKTDFATFLAGNDR